MGTTAGRSGTLDSLHFLYEVRSNIKLPTEGRDDRLDREFEKNDDNLKTERKEW